MTSERPPSRALLILAGASTQVCGAACLVIAIASVPIVHDTRGGTHALIAIIVAAVAAMVCGTLVYRGRLIPLGLAMGVNIGFGVVLPRGGSALGTLLRILPADDAATADALITVAAVTMFVAALLCAIAIPNALKLRQWARDEIARELDPAPPSMVTTMISQPADTLKGMGPSRLRPTQVVQVGERRGKPLIVIGVAVTVTAIGIAVITAVTASSGRDAAHAPSDAADRHKHVGRDAADEPEVPAEVPIAADAGVADAGATDALADGAPVTAALDDFVTSYHAALASAGAAELAAVLDAKAFAFGIDANEVAQGRDACVAMLRHDLGGAAQVDVRFTQTGRAGDVAWLVEELKLGTRTLVASAAIAHVGNGWAIAALELAAPMSNDTAYRLARDGNLAVPDAIPDTHDDSPLAVAMRAAFASKPSFVEARSVRPDAFNYGSALGERITGGDNIKKTFGHLRATLHLHDAVTVGALGPGAGWGAANVDFTDADRDGTEVTQTFRVLAVWLEEAAGWRIVQTQWSNPR